jgi:hypothetical protein
MIAQSRPLFQGRYLRWVEIRDDSHAWVNVVMEPRCPEERREFCSVPLTDEQLLDDRFGRALRERAT